MSVGLDIAIIERRLVAIREEVDFLNSIRNQTMEEFLRDGKSQRSAAKSIETIAHSMIDIASHIIAQKQWGVSESYKQAIITLSRKDVIGEKLSINLQDLIAMRNLLVHQYLETDYEIIWDSIPQVVEDAKAFVSAIKNFILSNGK